MSALACVTLPTKTKRCANCCALKPGAALLVLEFSKPTDPLLEGAYKAFQTLWPPIGKALVGDAQPYQYLVDSIRVHPDQKALRQMFSDAGFVDAEYHNLLGGIAAIHRAASLRMTVQPTNDNEFVGLIRASARLGKSVVAILVGIGPIGAAKIPTLGRAGN